MKTFENVSSLKLANIKAGQLVNTKGYYAPNDGGGALYYIVTTQAADEWGDLTIANGNVAVIQLNNSEIDVRQFGATGDGATDDTPPIQAAVDSLGSSGGTIDFDGGGDYVVDYIQINESNIYLQGNGCELISKGGPVDWAMIFGMKTISPDGVLRPYMWTPLVNVVIDNFVIDYANALNIATAPFNFIQLNGAEFCKVINCTLLNNFVSPGDTSRGNGVIYRGVCRNCTTDNNKIQNIEFHCNGHSNKYLVGDFTEAAGEFGLETYADLSEIDQNLRPADMVYSNNWCSDTDTGMAFDIHSYRGITHIVDNYVYNCNQFFKNQTGPTRATGNYILQTGDPATYLIWFGWNSSTPPNYPDEQSTLSNNIFRNCDGLLLVDHPTLIDGNHFITDGVNEITTERIHMNQNQVTVKSRITNNRFEERIAIAVAKYILIDATSPTFQGATTIDGNIFELYTQQAAGQWRLIDVHSCSPVSILNNQCVEQNAAIANQLVFAICLDSELFKVSDNTVQKGAAQTGTLAWNADNSAHSMLTNNIAIGCNVNGVFDVNDNNLLA